MQDNPPPSHDSLSHLPPQGYFDEQEAMAKLVPIAGELVALVEKSRAPQCLHQIQEPSAAEQGAWHAGLDEGRAQAALASLAVPMAEAWELSAADTELRTTGAGHDYNQGLAEGLRTCAKDLRAMLEAAPAAAKEHELIDWDSAHKIAFQAAAAFRPSYFNGAGFMAHNWVVEAIRSGHIDGQRHALGLPPIDRSGAHAAKLRMERKAATPAAAPVVLPEPDAVISEVMGLVDEWGMESHLRGVAELDAQCSEATQEEIDCAKDRAKKERAAWKAIESKLRALLATSTRLVLDYPWRDRLLDGRALVRDQQGFAEHPELPLLDEGMKPRAFFAALGVEMKHTMAEDDLSMDEYDAMNDAVNWSAWAPRPPIGDGWNLVAIFDTEDGPAAWWARAQETTPPAVQDAREFWGVIAPCGEGVFFNNEADARWTQTGHGSGSDGFGVPTIGEAFRESYEDDALYLVRVHIVAAPTAKGK